MELKINSNSSVTISNDDGDEVEVVSIGNAFKVYYRGFPILFKDGYMQTLQNHTIIDKIPVSDKPPSTYIPDSPISPLMKLIRRHEEERIRKGMDAPQFRKQDEE